MSVLTDILDALGLLHAPAETRNLLFWPPPQPAPATSWHPRLIEGVLAHPSGDLTTDNALRPRVSVILGPGATLAGVGAVLADLIDDITDRTTAAPMPSAPEVLHALMTYSATHLTTTPADRLQVGLRMPLPVEIDQNTGHWVTNLQSIADWQSLAPTVLLDARDTVVTALPIDDPDAVRTQVGTDLAGLADPGTLGPGLAARLLRNPYEPVFSLFEMFHQLHADRPADEPGPAMGLLDVLVDHQAQLLATTTGGAAVLRRLWSALTTPAASGLPAGQQPRLLRSRRLVAGALGLTAGSTADSWHDPIDIGPTTVARELPLPASMSPNPSHGNFGPHVTAAESLDGQQVMVLGRQLSAGRIISYGAYTGPSHGGRLDPATFATLHAADIGISPATPDLAARIDVVAAIADNEGWLDAARLADAGLLSTGLQQWTEHHDDEATVLWEHFRGLAPDHFDLYLGLNRLLTRIWGPADAAATAAPTSAELATANPWADPDVIAFPQALPADPQAHFPSYVTLYHIDPGQPPARMAGGSAGPRFGFFGGTITSPGHRRFAPDWAGYVRLAALCSIEYRVAEMQTAAKRFDRIQRDTNHHSHPADPAEPAIGTPDFTVPGAPPGPGGTAPKFSVADLLTTQYGAALVLDQHINAPGFVKADVQSAVNHTTGPAFVGGVIDGGWQERLAVKYQELRRFPDPAAKTARDHFLVGRLNAGRLSNAAGSFAGW